MCAFVLLSLSSQPPGALPVECKQAELPPCSRPGSVGCRGFCAAGREVGTQHRAGEGPWGPGCPRAAGREGEASAAFPGCGDAGLRQEQAALLAAAPAPGSGTTVRAQRCLWLHSSRVLCQKCQPWFCPVQHSHTPAPLPLPTQAICSVLVLNPD